MKDFNSEIKKELLESREEKYKLFLEKLIPNCDNIIGVRMPIIRKIAKKISKDDAKKFIDSYEDVYFEETMLKALVLANLNVGIDELLVEIEKFLPKITNWSLCDSFSAELKVVRKHKEKVFSFLEKLLKTGEAYFIRVAVVIALFHFIDDEYKDRLIEIYREVDHEEYYVKMAVAWAISITYIKYPVEVKKLLEENSLDKFTHNKACSKICESFRVKKEDKEDIKKIRR